MDEFKVPHPVNQTEDKFILGKKWFWIGVILALNLYAGLIYGIALIIEKKHRKEGMIILGITIAWTLIGFFFIAPWLQAKGYLPKRFIPIR